MRWTTDPGAIPDEPYDYLDIPIGEDGEIGEAKAVIVGIEKPLRFSLGSEGEVSST